jgi:microcystin-dependent protein
VIPYSDGATTTKVTVSQLLALQSGVPAGFIGLWSGAANAIPTGWLLCNGANGTPNLVDRFVVGAGTSTPAVGATGGSKDAIVVSHTHTVTDPGHRHTIPLYSGMFTGSNVKNTSTSSQQGTQTPGTNSATTGITIAAEGSSGVNANMPPYYALCYIMKS